MENVVLIIHLLLALGLIAVVLMQRSEGGGLGMGGGGGGAMTGRAAATALGKVTWILAACFHRHLDHADHSGGTEILGQLGHRPPGRSGTGCDRGKHPAVPSADDLLPPTQGDNAPLIPQAD